MVQQRPDIVLVDALLQGRVGGLELAAQLRRAGLPPAIVLITVPQRPVTPDPDRGIDAVLRLPVSTLRRPLLGTGLCGALTTFSTVQIELLQMADHHRYGLAAAYLMASVLCGYLAVFLSSALVRRVRALV